MDIDIESLERATLDAVAPPDIAEIDGWLLPLDRSTIGRAISAVPIRHDGLLPQQIDSIEAIYRSHGLQAQFRMPDIDGCRNMDAALEQRGYRPIQPTLVQVAFSDMHLSSALKIPVLIGAEPSLEWQSVYLANGFDPIDGANRINALSRSKFVKYAHIINGSLAVASGTASCSHGWVGLHGMRTVPKARGRGLATAIINGLLKDAMLDGPKNIYLQVEEANTVALRLYGQLGFTTAWRYHYWKKSIE
jgi:GNAT superfamily N-acetyltransferase